MRRSILSATGRLSCLFLAAGLATLTRAEMFRPKAQPGGIDAHPQITTLLRTGTNTILKWYGLEGAYHVQMSSSLDPAQWTTVGSALASEAAWSLTLSTVSGDTNFFRLHLETGYVGSRECSSCHSVQYGVWQQTAHAQALSALQGLPPSVAKDCLVCHTVGYGQPGGFVSTAETPHLTDVGCENCHGPGAAHEYGDHFLVHPARTLAAEACGGCHDGSHHPTYSEWTNSAHARVTGEVAAGFGDSPSGRSRMMSCGPCHSGTVRLAMLGNYQETLRGYTNELALPSGGDAAGCGQSCAVCHDPHATNGAPYQLRNPTSSTNAYFFVSGAATNQNGQYLNTVFATQYVASVQICAQCHNSRGARWTDSARPPHHSPQYNMLLGTVGELPPGQSNYQPAHARLAKQCVSCHMPTAQGEGQPASTGHSFKVTDYSQCQQCHPYPELLVLFTGESVSNQVQQVKAALDVWAQTKAPTALWTKYGSRAWEYTTPGSLSSGGPGPNANEQALIPETIKKARFNLYLVLHDGSYGVHNGPYAITLLDAARSWIAAELAQ